VARPRPRQACCRGGESGALAHLGRGERRRSRHPRARGLPIFGPGGTAPRSAPYPVRNGACAATRRRSECRRRDRAVGVGVGVGVGAGVSDKPFFCNVSPFLT
jgi:hypothetical protein